MEFRSYKELVHTLTVGKQLRDAIYVHTSALETVPPELAEHIARTVAALEPERGQATFLSYLLISLSAARPRGRMVLSSRN